MRNFMRLFAILAIFSMGFVTVACDDDSDDTNSVNSGINSGTNDGTDTNDGTGTNDGTDTNDGTGTNNSTGCSAPPRSFWNWDLTVMPPQDVEIPATCYGEGEHVYVYVDDQAWEDGMVTQEMVDNVVHAWEVGTAKHPDEGIYEHTTSVFGDPPDVDDDPHIIIFITPLGGYGSSQFDGYFKEDNETPGEHSNETEMVYIDCEHHAPDSEYLLGVLAHEFQHMLQWNADRDESSWVNETLSQASMYINGYWGDLQLGQQYLSNTASNKLILVYGDQPYDYNYGAGFLFAAYVVDRFGEAFFHDLSQDPDNDVGSMNKIVANYMNDATIFDLLMDWATANLLNDSTIEDGIYSYAELTFNPPMVRDAAEGDSLTPNLVLGGYYYARVSGVGNEGIVISVSQETNVRVRAIIEDGGTTTVTDVDVGATGSAVVGQGSTDATITFIIMRTKGADGTITVEFQSAV